MDQDDYKPRLQSYSRRLFLQRASLLSGMVALGGGSYLLNPTGAWAASPIKVGIATDLTGPISWGGIPNSTVAKRSISIRNCMKARNARNTCTAPAPRRHNSATPSFRG